MRHHGLHVRSIYPDHPSDIKIGEDTFQTYCHVESVSSSHSKASLKWTLRSGYMLYRLSSGCDDSRLLLTMLCRRLYYRPRIHRVFTRFDATLNDEEIVRSASKLYIYIHFIHEFYSVTTSLVWCICGNPKADVIANYYIQTM